MINRIRDVKGHMGLIVLMFGSTFLPWVRSFASYTFDEGRVATPFSLYEIIGMGYGWLPDNDIVKILPDNDAMMWSAIYLVLPLAAICMLLYGVFAQRERFTTWVGRFYMLSLTMGLAPGHVYQWFVEEGKDDFVSLAVGIGYGIFVFLALVGVYMVYFNKRWEEWKFVRAEEANRLACNPDQLQRLEFMQPPIETTEQSYGHLRYTGYGVTILLYAAIFVWSIIQGQDGEMVAVVTAGVSFLLAALCQPVFRLRSAKLLVRLLHTVRELYNELSIPSIVRGNEQRIVYYSTLAYMIKIAHFEAVLSYGTIGVISSFAMIGMILGTLLVLLRGDIQGLYGCLSFMFTSLLLLVVVNELYISQPVSGHGAIILLMITMAGFIKTYANAVTFLFEGTVIGKHSTVHHHIAEQ